MYCVYLLKSQSTKKLYIGITSNLQRRIHEHNTGQSVATKHGRPWKLVYLEGYASEADARVREKNLKYFGKAYSQLKQRIEHSLSD